MSTPWTIQRRVQQRHHSPANEYGCLPKSKAYRPCVVDLSRHAYQSFDCLHRWQRPKVTKSVKPTCSYHIRAFCWLRIGLRALSADRISWSSSKLLESRAFSVDISFLLWTNLCILHHVAVRLVPVVMSLASMIVSVRKFFLLNQLWCGKETRASLIGREENFFIFFRFSISRPFSFLLFSRKTFSMAAFLLVLFEKIRR